MLLLSSVLWQVWIWTLLVFIFILLWGSSLVFVIIVSVRGRTLCTRSWTQLSWWSIWSRSTWLLWMLSVRVIRCFWWCSASVLMWFLRIDNYRRRWMIEMLMLWLLDWIYFHWLWFVAVVGPSWVPCKNWCNAINCWWDMCLFREIFLRNIIVDLFECVSFLNHFIYFQ